MTDRGPIRAVVVGAGHRGVLYASYAQQAPTELIITAVVDPDPVRRDRVAQEHSLPPERRFESLTDLPPAGVIADVAIDATMDADHVPTAEWLLEAGYPVLLEKPIAGNAPDVLSLAETSRRTGRLLMICHVLRYSPFYVEVKQRLLSGELGEIMSIQMAEYVSFDHMATAYVRGRWANSARSGSGILLSKSCHDVDLMAWLCDDRPVRVASAGSRHLFTADRAPAGAGTRCVTDCRIESTCAYSARRQYLELGAWGMYAWEGLESLGPEPTNEQKLISLGTDNPYGRCVWHSDNDVLDRQTVSVEFSNGAVGAFTLVGNSALGNRTIEIVGTAGELSGSLETGDLRLRTISNSSDRQYDERVITTDVAGLAHGGGDMKLVADFVRAVRDEPVSVSSTKIDNSIDGHLIAFAAELALAERRWVDLTEFAASPDPMTARTFAAVFPHSDDLTIFAGGLIRTWVLEGGTGYFIKITNDDKDSAELSPGETMRRIERETEEVAAALGLAKVYGLGYQNHYLHHGQLIELRHRLITLFRFLRIDTVISFDPWARVEENPDHTLTGMAVEAACWMAGRGHDLPELSDLGLEPRAVAHKYYAARDPDLLDHTVDVTPVLADKRAALRLHRTPMERMWREHLDDHPDHPLSLDEFIETSFLDLDDQGRQLEQFRYLGPRRSEKRGV